MVSKISEGINVMVETTYQPEFSNAEKMEFMFAYKISIENKNSFPVRILRRHWFIFDSDGSKREVEGEGVVGIQPLILPGATYSYVSGCNLKSEIGRMEGNYLAINVNNHLRFDVSIPSFSLVVPFKLN